jgi:hypothetical protein
MFIEQSARTLTRLAKFGILERPNPLSATAERIGTRVSSQVADADGLHTLAAMTATPLTWRELFGLRKD